MILCVIFLDAFIFWTRAYISVPAHKSNPINLAKRSAPGNLPQIILLFLDISLVLGPLGHVRHHGFVGCLLLLLPLLFLRFLDRRLQSRILRRSRIGSYADVDGFNFHGSGRGFRYGGFDDGASRWWCGGGGWGLWRWWCFRGVIILLL